MRLLTGSLIVLLFVASPVFGQLTAIKVDGSSMPDVDIAEVVINQESGELVITSKSGNYEIKQKDTVPGDVSINSFTLNSATTANLTVGGQGTLRWSTSDAVTCSASSEPVEALDDWNSTTSPGIAGPATVTFPTAGVYNLRLECVGNNASVDSAVVTARVGSASITSFTVTPTSADRGADVQVTLSWSASNASVGCFGSSNWPNSADLPASGTRIFTESNIQPGTEYTLTCVGAFDQDSSTAAITVTEPQVSCDVGLVSKFERDWLEVFRSTFPGPIQGQIRVRIPEYGYYAVKFNSGDSSDAGRLGNIEASGTTGTRLGALSEVPGCFDVAPECKYSWGRSGGIIWDTTGTAGRCQLKPNTDYYWNMTFTDGDNPGSSGCVGTYCETYLTVYNP